MPAQLFNDKTKSAILLALRFVVPAFLGVFGLLWATTDKTLFWARFDVASEQKVQCIESKLDSLIALATSTNDKVTLLTNGRMTDLYDSGVERSIAFTYEEKLGIYRALFETRTMGLDSLRVLIRSRNRP